MDYSEQTQKHTSPRHFRIGLYIATLLILVFIVGCVQEMAGGPLTPIPDFPDCSVQLIVKPDKEIYQHSEVISLTATLRIIGACVWQTSETYPQRDFILLMTRADSQGNVTSLANEDTFRQNERTRWGDVDRCVTRKVDSAHAYVQTFLLGAWFDITQSELYDVSQPGMYTLTFIRLGGCSDIRPDRISSNVVTFTRLP